MIDSFERTEELMNFHPFESTILPIPARVNVLNLIYQNSSFMLVAVNEEDGFQKRTREKRERIIEAAQRLFMGGGLRSVAVGDVAGAANVSQVTIYKYFKDKHGLVEAILERYLQARIEEYKAIFLSEKPYVNRLRDFLDMRSKRPDKKEGLFWSELLAEYPDLSEGFAERRGRALRDLSLPFLDEGRKAGLVNPEVPDEAVIILFDIVRAGLSASPGIAQRLASSPETQEGLYRLVLFGLVRGPVVPS
jgi:AcrR family transcriptional regulator